MRVSTAQKKELLGRELEALIPPQESSKLLRHFVRDNPSGFLERLESYVESNPSQTEYSKLELEAIVLRTLHSREWSAMAPAVRLAPKIFGPHAVHILEPLLSWSGVREIEILSAIEDCPGPRASLILECCLKEAPGGFITDCFEISSLIGMVGRRGERSAVPVLLEKCNGSSARNFYREYVVRALANIPGPESLSALFACVQGFEEDVNPKSFTPVSERLSKMGRDNEWEWIQADSLADRKLSLLKRWVLSGHALERDCLEQKYYARKVTEF